MFKPRPWKVRKNSGNLSQKMSKKELLSIVSMDPHDIFLEIFDNIQKFCETVFENDKSDEIIVLLIVILGKIHQIPLTSNLQSLAKMIFGSNVVFRDDILAYVRYAVDLEEKDKQNLLPFADQVWSSLEVFCNYAKNIEGSANCWAYFTRALCKVLEGKTRDSLAEKYSVFAKLKDDLMNAYFYAGHIYASLEDMHVRHELEPPEIQNGKFKDATEYLNFQISYLKSYFTGDLYDRAQVFRQLEDNTIYRGLVLEDANGKSIFPTVRLHKNHPPLRFEKSFFSLDLAPYCRVNMKLPKDVKEEVNNYEDSKIGGSLIFLSTSSECKDIIVAQVTRIPKILKKEGFLFVDLVYMENIESGILDKDLFIVSIRKMFESKLHTLKKLKETSTVTLPMKEYFVDCENSAILPEENALSLEEINLMAKEYKEKDLKTPGMNKRQFEAFQLALTRKLSLIQGPPGTGKSTVALNIIQRILEKTPCTILVVAFQKYNLDKFLMNCSALTDKIVRIGRYLGDPTLERFTLNPTVHDPRIHRVRRQCIDEYEHSMNIFAKKLKIKNSNEENSHDSLIHNLNEVQQTSLKEQELYQLHMYNECRGARIIGMTTTGIAKYGCLLKLIHPSVVIKEEAENSPECQVITALTEHTQQLIFVGDAKRIGYLKELYFDNQCRNTSLFERLIENDINNILLNVQHRMHPHISDLVRETLYPDLIDGDIVKGYQPVRGISKNLFCVVLEDLPQNIDSLLEKFHVQNQKNLSKENFHEFVFIFSLANYLRQQGYKAHEVVIFTTGSDNEVESLESFMVLSPLLKDVRVKSVEKFQGQECRIGIISLATTDQNPNMVSIASDDRLYVLLTRAQEGLYIVGQLDLYVEMNETWGRVKENLQSKGCIGSSLSIKCEKHGCEMFAAGVEDFLKFSQEGCPTGVLNKDHPCYESN